MKKTAGALLVLLGLVSGACGGETTSSTKAAYIAEMDRRCKLAQDELAALPEPEGRAEAAERLKTMEELYRGLQKDLRTQRPSNGDDATLETFLDGGDRALRQMAVAHEAAAANDKARFEKAVAELNGISDAAAVAGREYGFKVCASPDASTDSGPDGQGEPDERVFEDDRL